MLKAHDHHCQQPGCINPDPNRVCILLLNPANTGPTLQKHHSPSRLMLEPMTTTTSSLDASIQTPNPCSPTSHPSFIVTETRNTSNLAHSPSRLMLKPMTTTASRPEAPASSSATK
jgi:hypothetical protein